MVLMVPKALWVQEEHLDNKDQMELMVLQEEPDQQDLLGNLELLDKMARQGTKDLVECSEPRG